MASIPTRPNRVLALSLALMAATVAGCDDEITDVEPEPEVTTIRVTVGASTIDVPYPTGTHTPIPLVVNQVNQMSFRFLGANGQDEPIVVAEREHLELRMTNMPTGWSFVPTGGSGATFMANLTPTTTGSFIPQLALHSTEHDHNEVQRTISVTVAQ
jgi:hypothetical protein